MIAFSTLFYSVSSERIDNIYCSDVSFAKREAAR